MRGQTAYNGFTDLEGHAKVSQDVRMHQDWVKKPLTPTRTEQTREKDFFRESRVQSKNSSSGQQVKETQCPGTSENQTTRDDIALTKTETPDHPTVKRKNK